MYLLCFTTQIWPLDDKMLKIPAVDFRFERYLSKIGNNKEIIVKTFFAEEVWFHLYGYTLNIREFGQQASSCHF